MIGPKFSLLLVALALAGCATAPQAPPPVQVTDAGPQFAASRFECGSKPLPPDVEKLAPERQGSAAAGYEARLRYWGQVCKNKLGSVGRELEAAGQVAK